jgi:hypothetical protein
MQENQYVDNEGHSVSSNKTDLCCKKKLRIIHGTQIYLMTWSIDEVKTSSKLICAAKIIVEKQKVLQRKEKE